MSKVTKDTKQADQEIDWDKKSDSEGEDQTAHKDVKQDKNQGKAKQLRDLFDKTTTNQKKADDKKPKKQENQQPKKDEKSKAPQFYNNKKTGESLPINQQPTATATKQEIAQPKFVGKINATVEEIPKAVLTTQQPKVEQKETKEVEIAKPEFKIQKEGKLVELNTNEDVSKLLNYKLFSFI